MTSPYTDARLRDWYFQFIERNTVSPIQISVLGFGPFERNDITAFIRGRGHIIHQWYFGGDVLIVGREGWQAKELQVVLKVHDGRSLKIYSQEMFLTFLASGQDPFDHPHTLPSFRKGHAALEYLSSIGFRWPDTVVDERPSSNNGLGIPLQKESPLSRMGYAVGKGGKDVAIRRLILSRAYEGPLPTVGDDTYMQEWGEPCSTQRLMRIAKHIASRCTLSKRQSPVNDEAIQDWEDDLNWLKETYYTGQHRFRWPSTYVG